MASHDATTATSSLHEHRPPYGASIHDLIHRSPSSKLYPLHGPGSTPSNDLTPPKAQSFQQNSEATRSATHPTSDQTHRIQSSTPSPKRRRLHLNPPLHVSDPSSIVVADMQNESDALHILALASGQAGERDSQELEGRQDAGESPDHGPHRLGIEFLTSAGDNTSAPPKQTGKTAHIGDFPLIKLGIIDQDQVALLSDSFFRNHHHFFVSLSFPWSELTQIAHGPCGTYSS